MTGMFIFHPNRSLSLFCTPVFHRCVISWDYKLLCWLTFKANLEINIWPRNKYLEAGKTELFKTELSTRKQFVELYTAFPHKSSEIYWPLYHRWNLVLNFEGSGSQCLRISPLVDIYNTIMHMKSEPVHIQCIYSLPILQILSLEVI